MTTSQSVSDKASAKDTGAATPTSTGAPEDQIGARIAEKRLSKNLTHDGLAKLTKLFDDPANSKSGISRTTIRGYEVGLYKPGTRELRLLSQALEVSPNWLIFGGPEPSPSVSTLIEQGHALEQTEVQKFFVALHLLRALDRAERDLLYNMLHGLAKLKVGETEYRAAVISHQEFGALVSDFWNDIKDGDQPDQERAQQLASAYMPLLEELVEKNLGRSLGSLLPKKSD